jgi:PmbA protein
MSVAGIPSSDEAVSMIDRALAVAEGDEADAVFVWSDLNVTRFANSGIHQNMVERSSGITLRVIRNGRSGVASSSSTSDEELRRIAMLAGEMAERSEPLEGFKGLYAGNEQAPQLETFDEETASLAPAEKARALKAAFDAGRANGVLFAGAYTSSAHVVAVGNSHAVRSSAPVTAVDALLIALRDRDSGCATSCARRTSGVDIHALGEEATQKATMLADVRRELEPGACDVILEPAALAEALEWMNMITFSGQSYEDGSSFFVDRLGKKVVGENITIADDPLDPGFLPFPFDMEGRPKRRTTLIDRGAPQTPALDTLMANRLGLPPNGCASGLDSEDHGSALHLSLAGGEATREELIAMTARGVWVTRFNYVNGLLEPKTALMTGMTRDGTFLIEDGKVTARLPNLRWTQPMLEALSSIDGLTRERRVSGTWWNFIGGVIAPVVRVRGWKFTGAQK